MSLLGQTPAPNFIVILADDLGWADLGCYGAQGNPTPELDRMAQSGVRFSDFYSASPVCSPSRAALLTGRYPFRSGIDQVLFPGSKIGIPPEELTLPELLQSRGYSTGLIGKWHLGVLKESLPKQNGFQTYFGIPYSHDMRPLVFMRGNAVLSEEIPIFAQLTRRYTAEAIQFLEQNRQVPFFLLLAHSMPHYPIDASPLWKGRNPNNVYRDTVQELDWSTGEILRALRDLDLENRTAVFFTSDNGSWRRPSNGPLRGSKSTTWEGGVRVPLIAKLPGHFQRATNSSLPAMMFDLFATILELSGIPVPADRAIDGRSLLPELQGEALASSRSHRKPSDPLFLIHERTVAAVRVGPWKLHTARKSLLRGMREIQPELYNLADDPGETHDRASRHVERMEELLELAEQMGQSVSEGRPPEDE